MNLKLVSFETAVLAKSKKFDIKNATGLLFFVDSMKNNIIRDTGSLSDSYSEDLYDSKTDLLAPEQELLKMWLRETHNIHVSIKYRYTMNILNVNYSSYSGFIQGNNNDFVILTDFTTYELALEAALQYGLNLIK